jgi:hypothetical protein
MPYRLPITHIARGAMKLAVLPFLIICSFAALEKPASDGWASLFDGTTLDDWVQRGDAKPFRVEGGEIVASGATNSFLCTTREYTDFELEVEFKIPDSLNSGIQIRSQCLEEATKIHWKEKDITIPAGRVHGYQIEIDPSKRAWTGGLYDEGRRAWLQNLETNEPARKAFKQDDWNKLRIACRGDSIKSWLNGVPAADAKDSLTRSGFIALQVAHGKLGAGEIRFRNIRLKQLPTSPAAP